jgi:hypothetical protein
VKKARIVITILICLYFLAPFETFAQILTVSPPSLNVPRGQSSTSAFMYQFSGNPGINVHLTSVSGVFVAGANIVETNHLPLTINIRNGFGNISENLQIPVRVIERTLNLGLNRFTYRRSFSGAGISSFTAIVHFAITTSAGATFDIQRVSLYFDNMRPEITVERNNMNLKAFADIKFAGSGLLQGFWEVNGRVLSHVNRHLTFGGSVTLETPRSPALPTHDPGTHFLRFVITNPAVAISTPSILYFVIPEDATCSLQSIRPVEPSDGAEVPYSPLRFSWEKGREAMIYLIGFYEDEKPDSKPVFSAYVRDSAYTLSEQVIKSFFDPGHAYYWKVMGFDGENNMICENIIQRFIFGELKE